MSTVFLARPRYSLLAGILVCCALFAVLGFVVVRLHASAGSEAQVQASPVSSASVGCLGRVEPASRARRLASPESADATTLAVLNVREGDRVEAGQVLGWFSVRDKRAAAVRQAEAAVLWCETKVAQVQAGAKSGDVAAAKARVVRQCAAEANARRELQRLEKLAQQQVISAKDFDDRRAVWEMTQAEQRAAEQELASVAEVRPVDVAVAEAELARSRTALELARSELALAELRAPIAGTVLKIHIWPGEKTGDKGILDLGNVDDIHVVAEVYETDLPRVRQGQSVQIVVPGQAQRLRGEVVEIGWQVRRLDVLNTDPVADIDARVVEVRVRVNPADVSRLARFTHLQVQVVIGS
ncbi:MAG: HlyD family efflux transporter periplasmic adaptor subunit [Verrucomicrobia bacterium]|nr:HlyD family efflux transporter periplasmic adaptor subunit [Verrucomicrobiota bacterium]